MIWNSISNKGAIFFFFLPTVCQIIYICYILVLSNIMKKILLPTYYRWGNWSSKTLSNLKEALLEPCCGKEWGGWHGLVYGQKDAP